jgi:deoxyribose-phosphate aldolase
MLLAVRDFYLRTGKRIGIKPAGGIRQAKEALHYLVMVKEILGDDWLDPTLFRFGASALLVDVTLQIARMIDGGYQNPDSFSLP